VHGVHPGRKAVLLGVHWTAPQTMKPKAPHRANRQRSWFFFPPRRHTLAAVFAALLFSADPFPGPAAQSLEKPSVTIDEDVTSFAFAPDGRIAYSVRRMFKNKKYDMQRDDIWLQDASGRRKRIFQGEHFIVVSPSLPSESERSSDSDRDDR